eukprot:g16596.t1
MACEKTDLKAATTALRPSFTLFCPSSTLFWQLPEDSAKERHNTTNNMFHICGDEINQLQSFVPFVGDWMTRAQMWSVISTELFLLATI